MNDRQSLRYQQNLAKLRQYYDADVERRDNAGINLPLWKIAERAHFLEHLQVENKKSLLEIGAGTGRDSLFFQENGLVVTATDLSAGMVEKCRQKGLTAFEMDFFHLDFPPNSFDAVYALNCLLHLPKVDMPAILRHIYQLIVPNGLFYIGIYGGKDEESDQEGFHSLPRFFAWYSDESLQKAVNDVFELVEFRSIPLENENGPFQFQSTIWRRPH